MVVDSPNDSDPARILIIDSNEASSVAARSVLEQAGFHCDTVSSPFDLGPAIRKLQPELVLVDVAMPFVDGDRLIDMAYRADTLRSTQMVLFSTLPSQDLELRAARCGAKGFIRKDVLPDELVKRVRCFLAFEGGPRYAA